MSFTPPTYNDTIFRNEFPAFADNKQYPPYALAMAWTIGANWMSQEEPPVWGIQGCNIQFAVSDSSGNVVVDSGGNQISATWFLTPLQQACDLMGAVIAKQLYGPAGANGAPSASKSIVPGPLTSASDNGTSSSYQIPALGTSAFRSLLLSSPPYGPLLLALLQVSAPGGLYIPSCRPSWVPP